METEGQQAVHEAATEQVGARDSGINPGRIDCSAALGLECRCVRCHLLEQVMVDPAHEDPPDEVN